MNAATALKEIKRLVAEGSWYVSRHALARQGERNVSVDEIEVALLEAFRCEPADGTNWKVHGPARLGGLVVVVAVEDSVVVVTVWRKS